MIKIRILIVFIFILGFLHSKNDLYVYNIKFIGNKSFPDNQLKKIIRLKKRNFLRKTKYNSKKVHLDKVSIKNFYVTNGFLNVKVRTEILTIDNDYVNIDIYIEEGKRYTLRETKIEGNKIFNEEFILNIIDQNSNSEYVNPAQIRKSLKKLKYEYLKVGKINISILDELDTSKNYIDLKVLISEGPKYYIENITISGLEKLDSSYVIRELQFKENQIYNVEKVNESKRRIFETGLFSSVEIIPVTKTKNSLTLEIRLRQYQSRLLKAEIGFNQLPSSKGGLPISALNSQGQWEIGQIFNTVANMSVKGEFGLSYEDKSTFTRQYFELYYFSPWMLKLRVPFNFKIYYEQFNQDYNFTKIGLNMFFGKKYSVNNYKLGRQLYVTGSLKTEFIYADEYSDAEERSLNFSFLKHNVTNLLKPDNGYYISLYPSLHGTFLGGNNHYGKIDTELRLYIELFKKIVFANRVKIGAIHQFVNFSDTETPIPIYDKFHIGGQTSLRGWTSPEDYEGGVAYGGLYRILMNSELRIPIYHPIGIQIFFDLGKIGQDDIFDKTIRWDMGFGLIVDTGLGPARVDFAFPEGRGKPTVLFSVLYMF